MRLIAVLLLVAPLVACGNSYHPEYHPVTVSNIQQSYSSPVYVEGTTRPVVVAPAPAGAVAPSQQPIVLGPITPEPPPGFFDR